MDGATRALPDGMQHRGFSLVEVLVALGLLCAAAAGGVHLLVMAVRATADARTQTISATLAAARLEQLRGLTFAYDTDGQRITDTSTNLTTDPPSTGGSGLIGAGGDSLSTSVPGFVDYLDAQGRWIGAGISPPRGAVFVRRWSIDPSAAASDLVVLQVLVRPLAAGTDPAIRRARGESRFVTLLARGAR